MIESLDLKKKLTWNELNIENISDSALPVRQSTTPMSQECQVYVEYNKGRERHTKSIEYGRRKCRP